MQSIFYHSFSGEGVFTGHLKIKDVHRAITLHPIKQPSYMYNLHNYFLNLHIQDFRHSNLLLQRQLLEMSKFFQEPFIYKEIDDFSNDTLLRTRLQLNKFFPETFEEMIPWDFFSKNIYSKNSLNPKRRIETYQQIAINDVVMEMMEMINKFSKQRGRIIDFKNILYGYIQVIPPFGVNYILDMLLTYKKYRGKKMTVPVRRHAYLQQTLLKPEVRDISANLQSNFRKYFLKRINFILPLSGRIEIFKRFLNNFEEVCLKNYENVNLAVVMFSGTPEGNTHSSSEIKYAFEDLRSQYSSYDLKLIEASGKFSRGLALEIGAKLYPSNALLFFVDVDIMFDFNILERIRMHSIIGKQVYFPIVFSQYNPNFTDYFSYSMINEENGYWRQFGYGIVSLYHSDLIAVGGLDITIEGWGKEDVDLYSKVVQSNLTVFRAADPSLIHVYHPIHCSVELENSQYEMCWGSKLSSLASQKKLADLIFADPDKYFFNHR